MIDWKGTGVLVIGGAGLIGRPLVTLLRDRGAEVTVFDCLVRAGRFPFEWTPPEGVTLVRGSAARWESLLPYVNGRPVVFNLAANLGGITHNLERPAEMFRDNIGIKLGVDDALWAAYGVETFVDASTACVYSSEDPVPTPESAVSADRGPWCPERSNFGYGIAKLCGEFLTHHLPDLIRTITVRFSNAYGPGDFFGFGCHVIPALIQRIESGENPLMLWGGGSQSRTFLFAEDAAVALIELAERAPTKTVCNVGVHEEATISNLAWIIAAAMGKDLTLDEDLSKPRGYWRRAPDLTVANGLGLTCTKEWVKLEEGIKRTVEWWKAQRAENREP